ncbi:MAG: xanthine dehydrogenase family protein molybdopterin-binding subunit [Candidatus Palauibacterales bacterium]|nr:xanthine dehydrogenase family protein molybdopterin-binding subunit [Candidatus Palauibacterales bacterium]MDP2483483.1 xanthine dehydrogenase family protein molybdopterin-binding subunit [Candidatus Palauibacterales bacterium]
MKRVEGLSKLTGRELYVDDLPVDGFLWGATVRSPAARGRIRGIRFDDSVDWSEFTVVDHRDIPGTNAIFLIEEDQPVLAHGRVRHLHEPVLLLAHPRREELRRAVEAVHVDVDAEPPVLDFRLTPDRERIQYGDDNVLKRLRIEKGEVERALAQAPHVIEGVYETGAQEHVYLETQGMLAWEEDGVITIAGSMQCPYYIVEAFEHALGRTPDRIRIIQAATGGGFGGKEEFPSGIALHAALLALKAGRPVKLIYDRSEDLAVTTKRHPSRVRHRTGVDGDGKLLGQDIEVVLDGGAYVTLSPVVLSRSIIHAAGPYACDHVRIDGRAMFTNSPPFGAFRGFGAPQSLFACERHMDRIAAELGIDPVEIRKINLIRDGDSTATGQVIADGADRVQVLDRALDLADYYERRTAHAGFNAAEPTRRRGIGLATFFHGAGFTGSGELFLDSEVHVAGLPDGRIEVRTANVEMGQGTLTVFTSLVCDRLGVPAEAVTIAPADTSLVPNSGPTVASRTVMVVGGLLEKASDDLRTRTGLPADADGRAIREAIREWHRSHPGEPLIGKAKYEQPEHIHWDDETYRGDAYGAYAWGAYVADVEVDLRTFAVSVRDFVAVQEVGRVLHETLARGQIQGGVVQALGWALLEECKWRDGAMENAQLTNYVIPTAGDVPPIRVEFLESPYPHGARGAKGIGELPFDGVAPAVANAVAGATGTDPASVPLTPETVMDLILRQRPPAGSLT